MFIPLALAMQLVAPNGFTVLDRPGIDPTLAADVRGICPSAIAFDRGALIALEGKQSERHVLDHAGVREWRELGCTRALLGAIGAIGREGPLMISGDSWAQGAIKSLAKALSLDPRDIRAAEALGVVALNESDPRDEPGLAALLHDVVARGVNSPAAMRACADFNIRVSNPVRSRDCSTRALRAGHDSTWHLLIESRLRFRTADTAAGSQFFLTAASVARDTMARLDVAWHLQWFVSPPEQKAWLRLADTARGAWIRDRVMLRDVRDGQPAGARLAEHFGRLEHVDSSFRLHVPKLLRNSMRRLPSAGMNAGLPQPVSTYTPPGTQSSDGSDVGFAPEFRDYTRWQVDWDDRGVVWMRFGKPLKDAYLNEHEVFYYEIDGKALLVTFAYEEFSGEVAPSRLVTGYVSPIFCGIDTWRCYLSSLPKISPAVYAMLKQQDREYVGAATTMDDNSIRTDKAIEVISRLHRLWDPITGTELALVTYAVKSKDLVTQKEGEAQTARVEFELRRWDAEHAEFQDTAFTRRFTTTIDNPRHLTGFLVTPSPVTTSSWSLIAKQSANRRGRAWEVSGLPLDGGEQAISDLVLGQDGQGVSWANHNVSIPLAPLNAVDRALPVSLYYQIRSATARAGLRTTIALYRMDGTIARDTAAMQLGFEQSVQSGINEVAPTIDVSRLEKGAYRLEVRLADERGAIVSRRTVQLNLE